jgi:hypothetical protein
LSPALDHHAQETDVMLEEARALLNITEDVDEVGVALSISS